MKIGLIDADLMWRKKRASRWGKQKSKTFPNLAIMKISAWHKSQGDDVDWYNGMEWYDRVYISKVFSDTPESLEAIQATEVIRGGSGYNIKLIDGHECWIQPDIKGYQSHLPNEVEHIMPDYSLYGITDTAYGFLSRGCPRGCHFCHVAAKEGLRSYKVADLSEWWSGQKHIRLCDPNILACKDWKDLLQQLADSHAWVDINQGMDARLITPPQDGIAQPNKTRDNPLRMGRLQAEGQSPQRTAMLCRQLQQGYRSQRTGVRPHQLRHHPRARP